MNEYVTIVSKLFTRVEDISFVIILLFYSFVIFVVAEL